MNDIKGKRIVLLNLWNMVNSKGGAEKVFCNMANELSKRGAHVYGLIYEEKSGQPAFPLAKEVQLINAGWPRSGDLGYKFKRALLKTINTSLRSKKIKEIIFDQKLMKKAGPIDKVLSEILPEVIISFSCEATYLVKSMTSHREVPLITMFHADPLGYALKFGFHQCQSAVNSSDCVQVLFPAYMESAKNYFPAVRLEVIPNCIARDTTMAADLKNKKICYFARYDQVKRQALAIEAFALLRSKFPDWSLDFYGSTVSATYRKKLQARIEELGAETQIRLNDAIDDVDAKLSETSIVIFPSEIEGFPLSVIEAMSMGIPVVGQKNCKGVACLVEDGVNGFLCEDSPEDIAKKLEKLMLSHELRLKMGQEAMSAMQQYSPERVWSKWEQLIGEVVR